MQNQDILPCGSFLDLAGGTGTYLTVFQKDVENYTLVDISTEMLAIAATKAAESVALVETDQASFFETKPQFDVVFSAMNPALRTKTELLDFVHLGGTWSLILRLVKEEDTIFTPFESQKEPDLLLNQTYKSYLTEAKIPFKTQLFCYERTETISREFFRAYFEADYTAGSLEKIITTTFKNEATVESQSTVAYELIYINKKH